jgi:hypothetical protein
VTSRNGGGVGCRRQKNAPVSGFAQVRLAWAGAVDSVAALWGLPLVLALLGAAFLFAGIGALVGWIPE